MHQRIHVERWNEAEQGPLSVDAIRERLLPSGRYRVSEYHYPPSTELEGAMKPGIVYVLSGECSYRFGGATARLSKGQFAQLPGGDYGLAGAGVDELHLVLAWPLPFDVASP